MLQFFKIIIISFVLIIANSGQIFAYETIAKQAILMDYDTGIVLYNKQGDDKMVPSSMTKLMTVYIAFDYLKKGVFKLNDSFLVSENAWKMGGSRTFLKLGERVDLETLLKGIIIQSGNDASVTVAEGISGSQDAFARKMNEFAAKLGLKGTHFVNPDGWPNEDHYMTAHDLALVAQALIRDFPEYYHYFAEKEYTYNNIKQQNRNLLINRGIGVDGLKTGHTEDGGYGLTASALREGKRLISVVNGLPSDKDRADEVEKMLDYGFHSFASHKFFSNDQIISDAETWFGEKEKVGLMTKEPIEFIVPKLQLDSAKISIKYEGPISAPIKKGDKLATLVIEIPEYQTKEFPLYAAEDVAKLGKIQHVVKALKILVVKK